MNNCRYSDPPLRLIRAQKRQVSKVLLDGLYDHTFTLSLTHLQNCDHNFSELFHAAWPVAYVSSLKAAKP